MVGARSECNSNPSIVFFSAAERIPGMAPANGVHQLQLQNGQMQQCKAVSVHCTAFEDCTLMPLLLVHWCWCLLGHLHLAGGALVLVVQLVPTTIYATSIYATTIYAMSSQHSWASPEPLC